MKIIRDGKEIELTTEELNDAWREVEHDGHRNDVIAYIEMWCDDNEITDTDKYLKDESLIDDITYDYEEILEYHKVNYDELWCEHVYEAVHMYLPYEEEEM